MRSRRGGCQLPELDEIESDLRRDRGLVETSGFVPDVDSSKGRYLALCLRRKGETDWTILREFLLLRRAGVEREAVNLLAPGLGGNLIGLESDVELGLMVLATKGAGGLGGSEYIRAMGSVEEVYSVYSTVSSMGAVHSLPPFLLSKCYAPLCQ
ncbi:MAG: hypothetical protein SVX43_23560 [Cyanobacteriota bacterium]|nr:hypothetical protein [Cyanobacteriota bacterium]